MYQEQEIHQKTQENYKIQYPKKHQKQKTLTQNTRNAPDWIKGTRQNTKKGQTVEIHQTRPLYLQQICCLCAE